MSTSTVTWIIGAIVMGGTLAWSLLTAVRDRREARRAKADFAKTKLAAELRAKPQKRPKKPRGGE